MLQTVNTSMKTRILTSRTSWIPSRRSTNTSSGRGEVRLYAALLYLDRKIFDVLTKNISGDAVEGPGVLAPPHNPDGPGELGKPVKIENPEPDVKKKIDQGWQDNAFNQVCMQSWLLVVPLNLT